MSSILSRRPTRSTKLAARLRLEALEDRVVPASTFYVNDNWFIANDVAPSGLTNGDTVDNRNDTGGAPTITRTFGVDAFSTMNAALAAASNGDTIQVLQGTYNELVTINKSVSFLGANAGVHPAVGANTTDVVGARGTETILSHNGFYAFNPQAANITIDGFEFTGVGSRVIDAAAGNLPNLHIANNIFANTGTGPTSGVIQLTSGGGNLTNLNIEYNLFQNRGSASSIYTGLGDFTGLRIANNKFNVDQESVFQGSSTPYVNAVVANNEFDGTIGGVSGAGLGLLNVGQGGNISISENYFHDVQYTAFQVGIVGGEVVGNTFGPMTPLAGSNVADAFQLWGGQYGTAVSTNVTITNNVIHFNDDATSPTRGIRLRLPDGVSAPTAGQGIDGTTIHVNNNTFIDGHGLAPGNGSFAILDQGEPTSPVDASNNWWSTTSKAAIAALMSGPVDFAPFLESGTDTSAAVGFQGDFSHPQPPASLPATLSGSVVFDANRNGVADASERGLAGLTVFADANGNGLLDEGESSAVTDAQGRYVLSGLTEGRTYVIRVLGHGDFGLTGPAAVEATALAHGMGPTFTGVPFLATAPVFVTTHAAPSDPDSARAFVLGLYQDLLGRDGSGDTGVDHWAGLLHSGTAGSEVARSIINSAEYRGRQVDQYYLAFLGRESDEAGRAGYVAFLQNGGTEVELAVMFLTSAEYQARFPDDASFVVSLYDGLLSRGTSQEEVAGWLSALSAGVSRADVVRGFLGSAEASTRALDGFYAAFLGREADEAGLAHFGDVMQHSNGDAIDAMLAILASDEYRGIHAA